MIQVHTVTQFLEALAPPALAESWDNVGLLVGDPAAPAERVMTCLTVTAASAAEAIREQAQLIVTHHPLPFRPLARMTTADTTGRLLWQLIGRQIAVYSAHTAFDSASRGINQRLAEALGLADIRPLIPHPGGAGGSGRMGTLDGLTLAGLARRLKSLLRLDWAQIVGDPDRPVRQVAVGCGSAGEFLEPAEQTGCDGFVTGEARFHTALEAEARGIGLVLTGHFASERFALESLAEELAAGLPGVCAWACHCERDPLVWI